MHRKRKRSKYNKQLLFFSLTVLLVFLVALLSFGLVKFFGNNQFKIESRVEKLEKAQKKDTSDKKTVGWIKVQGTNIDYPVVYAPDYDFSYEVDNFAWTEANYNELNNIIYVSGHNIKNLSTNPLINGEGHDRFEQLMGFTYYDFVKDNQFIQYTIGDKNYLYKIFAVSYQDLSDMNLYNEGKYNKEDMNILIDRTLESSIFDFGVDVNEKDSIISLDTCTRMYNSNDIHFTVTARLVREREKAKLSEVSKTSKYSEVDKIMKGGDSYDEA